MAIRLKRFFGPSEYYPRPCVEAFVPQPTTPLAGRLALLRGGGIEASGVAPDDLAGQVRLALASFFVDLAEPEVHSRKTPDGALAIALEWPDPDSGAAVLRVTLAALQNANLTDDQVVAQAGRVRQRLKGLGASTMRIARGARMLGLPVTWFDPSCSIGIVGLGAARTMWCDAATGDDSLTGHYVARHKNASVALMRTAGLPTTRARAILRPGDAVKVAEEVGYPCVVKPPLLGKGVGISTNIRNRRQLARAVQLAGRHGFPLLVENHVEGEDHRVYAYKGKVRWIYRRERPQVLGDGKLSVRELVQAENADRALRRAGGSNFTVDIALDDQAVRFLRDNQDMAPDDIPPAGTRVYLLGQANLARGGQGDYVTHEAHEDIVELARRAYAATGIASLGIDLLTTDISRSWHDGDPAIIEINTHPGIAQGDGEKIQIAAHPGKLSGRVPVILICGDDDFARRMRHHIAAGEQPATANRHTVRYDHSDLSGFVRELDRVAVDSTIEALLIEATPQAIAEHGFPLCAADAVIVAGGIDLPGIERLDCQRVLVDPPADLIPVMLDEIAGDFAQDPPGGPRDAIVALEPRAGDDGLVVRCWNHAAVPVRRLAEEFGVRDSFEPRLAGPEDIGRLLAARLTPPRGERKRGARSIAVERVEDPRYWLTAYDDIRLVPSDGDTASLHEKALPLLHDLNALLAELA